MGYKCKNKWWEAQNLLVVQEATKIDVKGDSKFTVYRISISVDYGIMFKYQMVKIKITH